MRATSTTCYGFSNENRSRSSFIQNGESHLAETLGIGVPGVFVERMTYDMLVGHIALVPGAEALASAVFIELRCEARIRPRIVAKGALAKEGRRIFAQAQCRSNDTEYRRIW